MKIKDGFIMKNVAGSNIIVPLKSNRFESIMTLSDSGAFIFEFLKEDKSADEIVDALCAEYKVDRATAKNDVDSFLAELDKAGLLCNE